VVSILINNFIEVVLPWLLAKYQAKANQATSERA
jgi:hypothetical protein